MQGQAGKTSGSLAVDELNAEVLWRNAPDCSRVPGVKSRDSAPDVGCRSAIINEERVRSAATSQKV
jgi:hypothetical protein